MKKMILLLCAASISMITLASQPQKAANNAAQNQAAIINASKEAHDRSWINHNRAMGQPTSYNPTMSQQNNAFASIYNTQMKK
jgi:Ni/Co efflux regulator RcnB